LKILRYNDNAKRESRLNTKKKRFQEMKVLFTNYQGANRKPLIKAIEKITDIKAKYKMSPIPYSYAFAEILTLECNGTLNIEGYPYVADLIESLAQAGFVGEITGEDGEVEETIEVEAETAKTAESATENSEVENTESTADEDTITIEVPKQGAMSDEKMQNLLKLAESKHRLLTKSLGRPLIINDAGDKVEFVFPFIDEFGIANIYSELATAMVRYIKKHQRVTATEKEVESEKFALRAWMVKLGMNGKRYSDTRKWFCRNLSGNASFSSNAKYLEMQESRRKTADTEGNNDEQ
jgi:hypothetical protein